MMSSFFVAVPPEGRGEGGGAFSTPAVNCSQPSRGPPRVALATREGVSGCASSTRSMTSASSIVTIILMSAALLR